MRIQTKIATTLVVMMTVIILILSIFMYTQWFDSIQRQVGLDAKDQATIIAEQDIIRKSMIEDNGYLKVNKAVESIQLKTGIQYLYIINREGRYYAHPIPERINTYYKVEDTRKNPLLEKAGYYYSLKDDAMVEAYVPIYTDGIKSGVVIIGIYNGRILQTIRGNAFRMLLLSLMVLIIGIVMAYMLSRNIKKAMYGLEPEAIALLLSQQETILEQIGEGLFATDASGKLLMINENAQTLLNIKKIRLGELIKYEPFYSYFENRYLEENLPAINGEWRLESGQILSIHMIGLNQLSNQPGYLFKIEDMSLVRERAEELTNIKQYTQALRAQNHEFMNKLQTVSGLIELESYDKVRDYIELITKSRKEMVEALTKRINVPVLSGLILAKYSKALENQIELILDEDAMVDVLPPKSSESDITSIIGNLIDNAIEAMKGKSGQIILDLYHDDSVFTISVADSGEGMSDSAMSNCFHKGFSTKGEDRGYGLFIIKEIVDALDGRIELKNEQGLVVLVTIPMI
jgi:sensor histidine kinase regulating citrate/malate metabolism